MMKALKLVKARIRSGVCSSLFLTFAFICPRVDAAKTAPEYRELGLLYTQQGRYIEAIDAMKKSVELQPENVIGRVNLGWTLHLAGREHEAAKSLWQAIYRNPFFVPAYNALGIVYLVEGNLSGALVIHSLAVVFKPDNEIAFYNLSLALHRLQVYNLAIMAANRAAVLEPNNPHPLVASAIAYWDSGDKKTAKRIYTEAINLDSRYRERSFLYHLKRAAFSSNQIQTVNNVRSAQ